LLSVGFELSIRTIVNSLLEIQFYPYLNFVLKLSSNGL